MMYYAAANDIIMLYPMVHNCFDTRGNTGEDFNNRKGVQPASFMKMIKRVLQPIDPNFEYK